MYKVYQIQMGDTIERVANLFHTTSDQIKRLNGIVGTVTLQPGGFLIVPVVDDTIFETYIVQKGDNMYAIARKYDINYDTLLELNGLDRDDYIYPDQEIIIPKKDVKIYKTQEGDTIQSITENIGVGYDTLNQYNSHMFLTPDQILFYR